MFDLNRFLKTHPKLTYTLIRFLTGVVFLGEGIQKFLYAEIRGAGRFEKMGFPYPEFTGTLVGSFEVLAGVLLLLGLFTRFGAAIVFVIMSVAVVTIKIPILLGESFGPFVLRDLSHYGFWAMLHEGRTDFSMLICSTFILWEGAGKYALDTVLLRNRENN